MKNVFGLIGIGLIAGVVIYALINKENKKASDDEIKSSNTEGKEDSSPVSKEVVLSAYAEENDKAEQETADIKFSAENSIHNRHLEAAGMMKEAVENIVNESEIKVDGKQELEEISGELDELLREE